ncbi:hypothetical protein ACMAZH_01070 [Arenicellales bacterium nBUS_45]
MSEVQVPQSLILRDAMMTAYSLTGSLSAASTLCSTLLDEELTRAVPGKCSADTIASYGDDPTQALSL